MVHTNVGQKVMFLTPTLRFKNQRVLLQNVTKGDPKPLFSSVKLLYHHMHAAARTVTLTEQINDEGDGRDPCSPNHLFNTTAFLSPLGRSLVILVAI